VTLRVISYGGGVQSTALVVLAVQGQIEADVALFANVGDDSEDPRTLAYVRDHVVPWAAERGLPIHEVKLTRRDGSQPTLHETVVGSNNRGALIPVRMGAGHPNMRACTHEWKLHPIGRWLKDHGASKDDPATVLVGISADEVERATNGRDQPYERRTFPLLDLGLYRDQCSALVVAAGLPEPQKSACYFCPFHRLSHWAELRRDRPDLFAKSVDLERRLNLKLGAAGRDPVWLTGRLRPLDEAVAEAQPSLFDVDAMGEDGCDEGVCFL